MANSLATVVPGTPSTALGIDLGVVDDAGASVGVDAQHEEPHGQLSRSYVGSAPMRAAKSPGAWILRSVRAGPSPWR